MPTLHARTEILLGQTALKQLRHKHLLIAGLGGVGGYVAECLARTGVGTLTLLDHDVVTPSNINRQLIALQSTIGQKKTAVMKARIADIDPTVEVRIIDAFMSVESAESLVLSGQYHGIADCIDTIACKAQMVFSAQRHQIPVISAMGAGNCLDVTRAQLSQLDKTHGCPLAREMRRRLRTLGGHLKYPVVYSDEPRRQPLVKPVTCQGYREKATNGTIAYLPAIFGLLMAGKIIQSLIIESLDD